MQYSKIFLTTQTLCFDLAPYLGYLPECQQISVESELISMFDNEAGQVSDSPEDQIKKSRILLNKAKLERMLGRLTVATNPATTQTLLGHYL